MGFSDRLEVNPKLKTILDITSSLGHDDHVRPKLLYFLWAEVSYIAAGES